MTNVYRSRAVLIGVFCLGVWGCEPANRNDRDREVFEELREVLDGVGAAAWRICDEPNLEVGRGDGVELFAITSARVGARDEVVVANEGTGELLFFDPEGDLIRRVGSRGPGPGDFTRMTLVPDWSSDSILVFDRQQRRLSVMDPEGGFERSIQLQQREGDVRTEVHGRLQDGRLLVREHEPRATEGLGLVREGARVVLHSSDGRFDSLLGEFEGDEVLFAEYLGMRITSRLPFLGTFLVAAGARGGYVLEGPALEVSSVAPRPSLPRVFRADVRVRAITPEQYSRWVEAELGQLPSGATIDETRRYYEAIFEPWELQVVDRMFVDEVGRLWIGSEWFRDVPQWVVLDEQLRGLAVVDVPPDFRPLHATSTEVIGVRLDSLDVEGVEVRCLIE